MRSLKLGLAATAMICALSATAQAVDCVRVAVAGESGGFCEVVRTISLQLAPRVNAILQKPD